VFTDYLVRPISFDLLCTSVPAHNMALGIEDEDRVIADTSNQLAKLRFAHPQITFERLLGTRVIHTVPIESSLPILISRIKPEGVVPNLFYSSYGR
jgi:hypothetical protein